MQKGESHSQTPSSNLDNLLDVKIGYGSAQEKLNRSVYWLMFSEGCQTIVLGLLLPVISKQWTLNTFQQSLLITIVYLGVGLGSFLQTYSDRYGRYSFILYDSLSQTVVGLFCCVSWNFESFLVSRFIYGVGVGICLPLSAAYISQSCPQPMRATLMAKSRLYWAFGCVFTCVICWLIRESWRLILLIICLPGLYALVEFALFGKQSLRYLWAQNRKSQVYQLVNYMCQLNDKPAIPKQQLFWMMDEDQGAAVTEDIPMKEMFNETYFSSTVRLIISWFSGCFVFYGITVLLPSILEKHVTQSKSDQNIKYLFLILISILEVVGFSTATCIMDHPLIGRKKGVSYGFLIVLLVSSLIILIGESNFVVLLVALAIIKFSISSTFLILNPYTAQIYETMIRGKAMGLCSVSGRIAASLIGFVGVYAMNAINGNGLYLIFVVLSGLAAFASFTMPFCTSNRAIS